MNGIFDGLESTGQSIAAGIATSGPIVNTSNGLDNVLSSAVTQYINAVTAAKIGQQVANATAKVNATLPAATYTPIATDSVLIAGHVIPKTYLYAGGAALAAVLLLGGNKKRRR